VLPKRQLFIVAALFVLPLSGSLLHGREAFSVITQGANFTAWRLCSLIPAACGGETSTPALALGAYDFDRSYAGPLAIEHFFIKWNAHDRSRLKGDLEQARGRNRWPLITVEPWLHEENGSDTRNLFGDITAGKYDTAIREICTDIKEFAGPVFVRWGHEMEYVSGRYPWATSDYRGYVAAYRYFVDLCRSLTKNIFYVWSPVGNQELKDYWPGAEYADYVGLSVYAFPDWDLAHYAKVRSFDEIFVEKYARVAGFNKPVMIAELGVTGTKQHQFSWLTQAMRDFARYPLLKSVVYFNSVDSRSAWPEQFQIPDWRVDLNIFPPG